MNTGSENHSTQDERIDRRTFLKRSAAAAVVAGAMLSGVNRIKAAAAAEEHVPIGSLIDLTKCDGCKGEPIPRCVLACRTKNSAHYPKPEYPLKNYWPPFTSTGNFAWAVPNAATSARGKFPSGKPGSGSISSWSPSWRAEE